jgi:hypothetical protein
MPSQHPSDSLAQRDAESYALRQLEKDLSCSLSPHKLPLAEGSSVEIDGADLEARVLVEVCSRVGPLKRAQRNKIAADVLKLGAAARALGGEWRKVVCMVDAAALAGVAGRSWISVAAKGTGVEFLLVSLPADVHEGVARAQARQIMVNGSTPDG